MKTKSLNTYLLLFRMMFPVTQKIKLLKRINGCYRRDYWTSAFLTVYSAKWLQTVIFSFSVSEQTVTKMVGYLTSVVASGLWTGRVSTAGLLLHWLLHVNHSFIAGCYDM